ncbi:ATP/GTP-binding protein [Streptosporangium sp. NPDC087985]|uniref:AAA family ATPase n=1 Tax=Streptosporangium sp. NPDC087985 TaxID=3366196 RepID=UPI0037FFE50E
MPICAVYGANASGKSNVLDALAFMRRAVLDSFSHWDPIGGVPREPFASSPGESSFGVDLRIDGVRHVYGFAVDDRHVLEEWLFTYPHGRRRVLFERHGSQISFGDSFKGPRSTFEELTRSNALFLSVAAHLASERLLPVYGWFKESVSLADPADSWERRKVSLSLFTREPDRVVSLLRAADLGIDGMRVESTDLAGRSRITFRHCAGFDLPFEDESRGTQIWFDHLGVILHALDTGTLLAVDELDRSLHPLLVREFVRLFRSPATNPRGAQLVFTTHDASLLSRHRGEELLDRDEVWFTEKDQDGATAVFPLTDFKPRQGLNWERRYLGGAVRAVPFLDEEVFQNAARQETAHG